MKHYWEPLKIVFGVFAVIGVAFICVGVWSFANIDYLYLHGTGDVGIIPYLFTILGGVFSVVAYIIFTIFRKKSQKKNTLVSSGKFVLAEISGYVPDFSRLINGRPSYRLESTYHDSLTGKEYRFYSEEVFRHQGKNMGEKVKVYVNDDLTDYFIALEDVFL